MSNLRAYDFVVGIEASAQPDAGTPMLPNDLITLSFLETYAGQRIKLVNTYASPGLISAGTAINPTIESDRDNYLMFIAGNGGPVDMSANPQIVAPGRAGITLTLVGCHPTNSVLLENGTGLAVNGPKELADKDSVTFISIDANTWQEKSDQ